MNPSITERLQSLGWDWKGGVLTPPKPSPKLKETRDYMGSRYSFRPVDRPDTPVAVVRRSKGGQIVSVVHQLRGEDE